MKQCTFYLIFALLFGAAAFAPAQEKKGKLGDFADDYEKKKDKKEKEEKKNCSDDSDDDSGWFGVLINIFFSPDDDSPDDHKKDSTGARESPPPKPAPYPYRDDRGLPIGSPDYRSYNWLAEVGYLHLDDGLLGFQLAGDFRAYRFATNLDLHTLVEDLGKSNASLTFFGLNAGYEVIATPYLLARPYAGVRNMSYLSSYGLSSEFWGPEVGAKLLMLPRKPINVEANFSHAWLNGKPLTIASGSLGVMIKRVELRLGGQMFRSEWTALDGVKVGLRLWL